jgi:hypothetical protein
MGEIIGVLFAILVSAFFMPKFATFQKVSIDNNVAAAVAQQEKLVVDAGSTYIQQNSSAIQSLATNTSPVIITVAMLQAPAVNLLDASFNAVNSYGQTWQIAVLQPSAGNLHAMVMATGGTAMTDKMLSQVAANVPKQGGFIPLNDTGIYAAGNAYGTGGTWTIPTANFTGAAAGHPAALLTFNNGQLVSNYLYRNAVPGQPQLNTMTTPLVMGSVQTVGSACGTTGAIAQDGTGVVLSCQAGVWNIQGPYWQAPVATFAALPACSASSIWQTRVVKTPTTGTGPRSYTCDGATWQALGVNDAGNLTVAGTLTVAKLNGNLQITSMATDGGACAPDGQIAMSTVTSGLLLSCQSGVWKKLGGQVRSKLGTIADYNAATTIGVLSTDYSQPCPYAYNFNCLQWKLTGSDVYVSTYIGSSYTWGPYSFVGTLQNAGTGSYWYQNGANNYTISPAGFVANSTNGPTLIPWLN